MNQLEITHNKLVQRGLAILDRFISNILTITTDLLMYSSDSSYLDNSMTSLMCKND